jgi:hypothetical protein
MTITIDPALESYVREHAQAEGLTVDAYIARLRKDRFEDEDAADGIRRGLADVADGHVTSLQAFEEEFREHANLPRRPR